MQERDSVSPVKFAEFDCDFSRKYLLSTAAPPDSTKTNYKYKLCNANFLLKNSNKILNIPKNSNYLYFFKKKLHKIKKI